MIRLEIRSAAMKQWHGWLFVDGEEKFSARGPRPGCVARDLLNWVHYNLGEPTTLVELEVVTYE